MHIVEIYFFLGAVMVLVVLWDFKTVPKTAKRFVKVTGENETGFALIVLLIRNMLTMAAIAFFAWPAIILWELSS